jgi:hypothetical protein
MEAIVRSSCPDAEAVLHPVKRGSTRGRSTNREKPFACIDNFTKYSFDGRGCVGIIRVSRRLYERHLTDAHIGIIAYMNFFGITE